MTAGRSLVAVVAVVIAAAGYVHAVTSPQLAPQSGAVYWCPMHHDVRGRSGDKCHQCGMGLMPMARADYEPFVLDFETTPRAVRAGQKARVRFYVHDPRTNAIVRRFEAVHERIFHLFVISRDLEYFAHVHPTLRRDGSLDIDVALPEAGVYRLIADFLPAGGSPQLVQKSIVTAGYHGPLVATAQLAPDLTDKVVGDARVKLTVPEPRGGREQLLTFELADAATQAPVTDLEPYLGASGHLLLVSGDLAIAAHFHPVAEISAAHGPAVVFQVLFPRAGDYRMWAQFQRQGRVFTAPFTVRVAESYD